MSKVNNINRLYGAKFKPSYLCIGKGRKFAKALNFMSGFRGKIELLVLKGFLPVKTASKQDVQIFEDISKNFVKIKDGLLFDTSAYKDTNFVGIIEDYNHQKYFIKYYKKGLAPKGEETPFYKLKSYVGRNFKLAEIIFKKGDIEAYQLLEKQSNVQENELVEICREICAEEYLSSLGPLCFAHGDFTHWNVIKNKAGDLCLIDYEELGQYPPFYDLFHLLAKPKILNSRKYIPHKNIQIIADLLGKEKAIIYNWYVDYLRIENDKSLLNIRKYHNKALHEAVWVRKQIIAQVEGSYNILATHQGYELYGSDRMYLLLLNAIKYSFNKIKITADIPQKGALFEQLKKDNVNTIFSQGWVLRKKNFRQGFRNGFAGFFSGLKKARLDYKTYDIIFINTIVVINYLLVGIFSRKPKILYVHEVLNGSLYKIMFSLLITFSRAKCIFVSKACMDSYYLPFNKCAVVHNCLPTTAKNNDKLQNNSKLVSILIIGRIDPNKGHEVLLKALANLSKQSFELNIVGDVFEGQQHYLHELKLKAKEFGLEEKVRFHKFQSDVSEFYQQADIVIMPSMVVESFGLVVVEAYSYSKPVIVSSIGGLAEIVQNNETGLIVEAGDVAQLTQAIDKYLKSKVLRLKHGKNGYKLYEQKFTKQKYLENMSQQIKEFIN